MEWEKKLKAAERRELREIQKKIQTLEKKVKVGMRLVFRFKQKKDLNSK